MKKQKTKLNKKKRTSSFSYESTFEALIKLPKDEFASKFEKMMDLLNMKSDEIRQSLLEKDKNVQADMLTKFMVTQKIKVEDDFASTGKSAVVDHSTAKAEGSNTPMDYAKELAKPDIFNTDLMSLLNTIKINLTLEPISWTDQFIVDGVPNLFSLIDFVILQLPFENTSYFSNSLAECIRCLSAVMNTAIGLDMVISNDEYMVKLANCILPSCESPTMEVTRLLAALSLVNYERTLKTISIKAVSENKNRFEVIILCLSKEKPVKLKVSSMVLINALISGTDDIDLRIHLRNETGRCGIIKLISEMKLLENDELNVQLAIFEELMQNDANETHNKFYDMQASMENINEVYKLLYYMNRKTSCETYLLSIFQHFLYIREDPIVRAQYFRLIEEIVSQVVLQKNGVDPDFKCRPVEFDFENLVDEMCNEEILKQATSKFQAAEAKYQAELTEKHQLEAKLAVNTKTYEEKYEKLNEQYQIVNKELDRLSTSLNKDLDKMEKEQKEKFELQTKNIVEERDKLKIELNQSSDKIKQLNNEISLLNQKIGDPNFKPAASGDIPPPPPPPPPSDIPPPPPPPGGIPPPPPPPGDIPPPPPPPGGIPPPPPPPGGIPPPPPPPGGMPAPPPPPGGIPAPPGAPCAPNVFVNPKKKYKLPVNTKRLNWIQVKTSVFQASEKGFWKTSDEEKFEKDDVFKLIIDSFGMKKIAPKAAGKTEGGQKEDNKKKVKEPKILDPKTVQNLSIYLGRIKVDYNEIKRKFLRFDKEFVTENLVESFQKNIPPTDMRSVLDEFKDSLDELPDAELFIYTMNGVSRLDQRLSTLSLVLKFPEQLSDLKPQLSNAISACKQTRSNEKFHSFLKLVLLFGNYMNSGSKNERTLGFDLRFLKKLKDTKTTDNTKTFVHFLNEVITNHYPDICGFEQGFDCVDEASKISQDDIIKSVNSLKSTITNVEKELEFHKNGKEVNADDLFYDRVSEFLIDAKEQLSIIEEMNATMTSSYSDLVEYFSVDAKSLAMNEVFEVIGTFISDYNKASNDNKKRKEKEEREAKMKLRKEEDARRKQEKKAVSPINKDSKTNEKGVMDGLLKSLQNGSAFRQIPPNSNATGDNKDSNKPTFVLKKKVTPSVEDQRHTRTRTMKKNAQDLFSAMVKDIISEEKTPETKEEFF